jgi:flagellin
VLDVEAFMGLYITNTSAMFAIRQMNKYQSSLDTSYQRLASGLRINSAKDDPAGMQIAHRLTSEINGLTQGNRNAQDGISLAQTAEGALDEVTNMLQRIRTLALQSSNGTNSESDRSALNEEAKQLYEEINRISSDTTYGGSKLLDGSRGNVNIQVGAYSGQGININLDFAFTVAGMSELAGEDAKNAFAGGFDLSTEESSQNVLDNIDSLIKVVDGKRGELGAVQNRFESTIRYQSTTIENLTESRSRIQDCDYAAEVANMVQSNIQLQAATAILSQANQRNNLILSLINSSFS